jgi:hypothetical protein
MDIKNISQIIEDLQSVKEAHYKEVSFHINDCIEAHKEITRLESQLATIRQDTARECAEIVENTGVPWACYDLADSIRQRFGVE